jgi:hypothetical protein
MTQFILHVGPPKTGTTYLQEAFAATRPMLAERGIVFPVTWGARGQHDLPGQLRTIPNPTLEAQFAELHAARQPAVLISAEALSTLPAESVAYLRTLIGAANKVRVVFYVRSWADVLPSQWKQAVKSGDTQTLPEYLYGRATSAASTLYLNFAPMLRVYAEAFGERAISIVCYNTVVATERDLFQHFAATFLNWYFPPEPELPRVHVSPGTAEIEVIRAINGIEKARLGRPPDMQEAAAMSKRYMRQASDIAGPALRQALAANMDTAVFNEQAPNLTALHRQLFEEFGRAVVAPNPKGFFFQRRRVEIPYVRRDYLLAPGAVEELRDIHRRLYVGAERADASPGRSAA